MGRGWGDFVWRQGENVKFGFVAAPERASPRSKIELLNWLSSSPAALSVLYTLPRLHPTAFAISVAPIPSLRSDTMRARSKVTGRPL